MSCGSTACQAPESFISATEPTWHPDRAAVHSLIRWTAAVKNALRRRRERQALLELDDRLLDDIGLTREQAEQIGRKPMWK